MKKSYLALVSTAAFMLVSSAYAQAPQNTQTGSRDAAVKECSDKAMKEVPIARAEPSDPAYSMRYNVYAGCLAEKKMNP